MRKAAPEAADADETFPLPEARPFEADCDVEASIDGLFVRSRGAIIRLTAAEAEQLHRILPAVIKRARRIALATDVANASRARARARTKRNSR